VGQLVALVLQPFDRVDDMTSLVDLGPEQILQQSGGLEAALSDGGEEVEETFITGEKAHGGLRRLVTMR
jgi:hypothetical protein